MQTTLADSSHRYQSFLEPPVMLSLSYGPSPLSLFPPVLRPTVRVMWTKDTSEDRQ